MSQTIFNNIDPTVTTGLMLAGLLDDFKDALVSGCSGTTRPTNILTGGMWIDTSFETAPNYYWTLKIYNGTTDVEVFRISVLTGTSGFNLATDQFTIRKVSANTAGAILNLVKNRILTNGQVLSGDTVAELRMSGRTNSPTDPIVAYLRATASENQTSTNRGTTLSLVSTPVGTGQLVEHLKFLSQTVETVQPHKLNSLIYGADSVATASSMLINGDKILSELTGATAANIHGIEVEDGETRVKYIHNRSSATATVKHASVTATAPQRFSLPYSRDITLMPQATVGFYYCTADSRWKYLSGIAAYINTFLYDFVLGYSEWVSPVTGEVRVITKQGVTTEMSAANSASAVSKAAGNGVFAWGLNTHGQLGTNDVNPRSIPVLVRGTVEFKQAMISGDSSSGVDYHGIAYAWGSNANGELGVGDVLSRSSPVAILGGLTFTQVEVNESSYGINYSGYAFAWGKNQHGQLGVGDVLSRSSPVAVAGGVKFAALFHGSSGEGSTFGVERDTGLLYAWGQNGHGRLGLGDMASRSSPVAVLGGLKFRKVALGVDCTVGLNELGAAYAWGQNVDGELGVGNTNARSSPVAVLGGLTFIDVFALASGAMSSFFGLTEDGTLYGWGANDNGQLGLGDVLPRSSPVAVLGGLKFESMARLNAGTMSVAAIQKGTGVAYAWGFNSKGQLGLGDILPRSSPVAVLGGLKFSSIRMGEEFSYGCANNGKFYAWGLNSSGQLGDNSIVSRSSPVVVLGLTEPFFEAPTVKVIPVVAGQTYKIKLCGGASFFGDTFIGKNVRSATVSYDQ